MGIHRFRQSRLYHKANEVTAGLSRVDLCLVETTVSAAQDIWIPTCYIVTRKQVRILWKDTYNHIHRYSVDIEMILKT